MTIDEFFNKIPSSPKCTVYYYIATYSNSTVLVYCTYIDQSKPTVVITHNSFLDEFVGCHEIQSRINRKVESLKCTNNELKD